MNPNNDSSITLDSIQKNYGDFTALKPLNLEVHSGELFGFLGPNGAGKTTLIRIMTGIIKPTSGNVYIKGKSLIDEPEKAKAFLGYVPDRPYLYEKLSPMEYFDFIGGLYNIKTEQIKTKSEAMLNMFELWDKRNDLIESFSHGMKQKIAMTAAVLHNPEILIVDEPTVGLDPKSVKQMKIFFKEMVAEGKTIFLTTHTLSVAEDLCSRIAIIKSGEICALGSLDQLQQQAGTPEGHHLEEVFLKLTEENE